MIWRAALAALGALLLGGCEAGEPPEDTARASAPILYEISVGAGEPRGWLFGTIHSLPDRTRWRTPALEAAIADADLLMVEIAALENQPRLQAVFARLSQTPGQGDIARKVPPQQRKQLSELLQRAGLSAGDLAATETWAAALMLAQLGQGGDPANGADRAIIRQFLGREIVEFEGIERQLGIFDRLPEREQRDLLAAVIDELDRNRADPARLRRAWLAGDEQALVEATQGGLLADPQLREALLVGRNRDWLEQLLPVLETGRKPMVAVGAAHIVGPDGLVAMLRERGYTLTRVQ